MYSNLKKAQDKENGIISESNLDSTPIMSHSKPDSPNRVATPIPHRKHSFSPISSDVKYNLVTEFEDEFTMCLIKMRKYINIIYDHNKRNFILIDGSNMFYFEKSQNEWQRSEEKVELLRGIPDDCIVIMLMKRDTFDTTKKFLPVERILQKSTIQEVIIITLNVPFCSSSLMTNCILKLKDSKPTKCSLSQPNKNFKMRSKFTEFRHIFCEYDDIVLTEMYNLLPKQDDTVKILSLDYNVLKDEEIVNIYNEIDPSINVQIFIATM